jgi:hypothetical protein
MLATAKLTPWRLRSTGTPGIGRMPGAIGVGSHADGIGQAARQNMSRADHEEILAERTDKSLPVLRIFRAQAQIHNIDAVLPAPSESAQDDGYVRRQTPVEYFDGVQFRVGRHFANRSRHRRAVAQPVDPVRALAVQGDRHSAGDFANVRMAGMNSTIYDRDLHAESCYLSTWLNLLRLS